MTIVAHRIWIIVKSILVMAIVAYAANTVICLGIRTFTDDEFVYLETGSWPYHSAWETTVPPVVLGVLCGLLYYLWQSARQRTGGHTGPPL